MLWNFDPALGEVRAAKQRVEAKKRIKRVIKNHRVIGVAPLYCDQWMIVALLVLLFNRVSRV